MHNDELFMTFTTQTEADLSVHTYNTFVHDGTSRVAYINRVGPCQYEVWFHTVRSFFAHLAEAA